MIVKAYNFYQDLLYKLYPHLVDVGRLLHSSDVKPVQDYISDEADAAIQMYVPNLVAEGNFNTWQARVDFAAFDDEKVLVLADPFTSALKYDSREPDFNNRPLTRYERHAGYSLFIVQYQFKLQP